MTLPWAEAAAVKNLRRVTCVDLRAMQFLPMCLWLYPP